MSSFSDPSEVSPQPPSTSDGGEASFLLYPASLVVDSEGGKGGEGSEEEGARENLLPAIDGIGAESQGHGVSSQSPLELGRPSKIWRGVKRVLHITTIVPFQLGCLVILLALLSVIPVIQLVSLGYLLDVSGRLGRGESLGQAVSLRIQAGRIGLGLFFLFLLSQPIRLVSYWSVAAELIEPGNPMAGTLSIVSAGLVGLVFVYLAWAWVRGGKLRHYLWPEPIRFVRVGWRLTTWDEGLKRLMMLLASLRLPQMFWLGFRGFIGVLVWIAIPATLLVAATRQGETGLAGLVGAFAFILMGGIVGYLPMLQAQMATANQLSAIFRFAEIRKAFASAPFASWFGTSVTLLISLPLYLLKIEPIPKEIAWLPAVLFVAFMLLGHIAAGWAYRRSQSRLPRKGFWNWCWRSLWRVLSIPVVFFYMIVLYFSQLTSWDGLATWFQQHAFLVPYPFTGL